MVVVECDCVEVVWVECEFMVCELYDVVVGYVMVMVICVEVVLLMDFDLVWDCVVL